MQRPNRSFYIVIILFACLIIYGLVAEIRLKSQGIILKARTNQWISGAKSVNLEYEFVYKNKKIVGYAAGGQIRGIREFENRSFPVIYYPGLGGHSQLLLQPSDFKKYDIPFPDSLSWVLQYLNK